MKDKVLKYDVEGSDHADVKALHNKVFATLSERELGIYHHYMTQGRKYGITVMVNGKSFLTNRQQEEIARTSNARVEVNQVVIGSSANGKPLKSTENGD